MEIELALSCCHENFVRDCAKLGGWQELLLGMFEVVAIHSKNVKSHRRAQSDTWVLLSSGGSIR